MGIPSVLLDSCFSLAGGQGVVVNSAVVVGVGVGAHHNLYFLVTILLNTGGSGDGPVVVRWWSCGGPVVVR